MSWYMPFRITPKRYRQEMTVLVTGCVVFGFLSSWFHRPWWSFVVDGGLVGLSTSVITTLLFGRDGQ